MGAAVIRLLHEHADDIAMRAGCRLEVARVAVNDVDRERDVPLGREAFTTDGGSIVEDPDIDIVCELLGGTGAGALADPARLRPRQAGRDREQGAARQRGQGALRRRGRGRRRPLLRGLRGRGIPLIRPLKESLTGERVSRILGIVNGTTNYILTQMSEHGWSFDDALAEAQRLGYAEADPTADVEGHDAAAKCAILASIAFNTRVVTGDVFREGITGVTALDIADAARMGYVVKLLALAELEDGEVCARVHPAMIPASHPLASVRDAFNAVFVEGPKVGQLMFYGRGAGGDPTATAVVGDLVTVARHLLAGVRGVGCTCTLDRKIRPMDDTRGQYYLNLHVEDRPGVLAEIADHFGRNGISIERVWQEGSGDEATLVFVTHRAQEGPFQKTLQELRELPAVRAVSSVLRVEGDEP